MTGGGGPARDVAGTAIGAGVPGGTEGPGVVDCQWHWHPTAFLEAHLGRSAPPRAERRGGGFLYEVSPDEVWHFNSPRFHDLDTQVARMENAGIDAALMSPSVAGDLSDRPIGEARELSLLLNEELSRAQARYPGRVHGLAVLPLGELDAALSVLDDAVDRLALKAVMIPGNVSGQSIADRRLWPLYEEIDRRGLTIFLHPTRSFRSPCVTPYNLEIPMGYMFDTSFAMMSLIVSGLVDHLPRLKIVHPHVGGALPYLVARIEIYRDKGFWPGVDRPVLDYLRDLWFDLVCDEPEALELFGKVIGFDRLLFSSDFPYWSASKAVEFARRAVPVEHLAGVLGGHARTLVDLSPAP